MGLANKNYCRATNHINSDQKKRILICRMIRMIRSSNHWEWNIASSIASPPTKSAERQQRIRNSVCWSERHRGSTCRRSEARSCHLKTLFQMDTNVLELKAPMNMSSSRYRLIMMAKWCLKSQEELRERLSRDRSVNPNQHGLVALLKAFDFYLDRCLRWE